MNEAAKAVVDDVLSEFVAAARSRNVEAGLAVMAPDATLHGSGSDEVATGTAELRAFFEAIFALPFTVGWTWETSMAVQRGDVIWYLANGFAVVQREDGTEESRPYRLTGVLGRREGRWVIEFFNGTEPAPDDEVSHAVHAG